MTKAHLILPAIAAAAIIVQSCEKSETENTYTRQDQYIESLVKSLAPEESEASVDYLDGAVRVTVAHGDGEALKDNGTVTFYYAGHCINSSSLGSGNLFVTNSKDFAKASGWSVSDSSIFNVSTVNLAKDDLVKGLRKGIVGVRSGDECYVMFNGKYGFGKHTTGKVPAYSALAYHLWITGVSND